MDFVSIRIITADVARLVGFYERVTGIPANWPTEDFAENRSVIVEFLVDDVDGVHQRLTGVVDFVQEPTTMPWGNRSPRPRRESGQRLHANQPPGKREIQPPLTDDDPARQAAVK